MKYKEDVNISVVRISELIIVKFLKFVFNVIKDKTRSVLCILTVLNAKSILMVKVHHILRNVIRKIDQKQAW